MTIAQSMLDVLCCLRHCLNTCTCTYVHINMCKFIVLLHAASKVVMMKQCSGKIVVKSKNSLYKLIIPYQASVLHGLVLL